MMPLLRNIQGLRALAVLAVVCFHLQNIERKYSSDYLLPDVFQLGAAGVDVFFLVSGFIMIRVSAGMAHNLPNALRFLLMRAIRIYPLYWLTSALVVAGLLFYPGLVRTLPQADGFLLRSFLLLPQQDLPLLSVGWTLVHEMYFYAVFTLLLLLPASWQWPLLAAWPLGGLTAWLLLQPGQDQPWLYLASNPLTLEFVAGCFIARWLSDHKLPQPVLLLWLGVGSAIASWYWWNVSGGVDFPVGERRVLHFLLPAALLLAGAVALELQGKVCHPVWQRLGDASYSIYLTHILLLSAGGRLWQRMAVPDSPLDNLLWLPLLLALTLAGGMACHYWVEKPLLGWLRRLLPGRFTNNTAARANHSR